MLETLYKNAINIYVFKIINQSLKQNIFGRQWISETITPSGSWSAGDRRDTARQ